MTEDEQGKEKVAPLGVAALRVFYVGVGILLALTASLAAMVGFYTWKTPARNFVEPKTFPAPSVFQSQAGERRRLIEEQRRRLDAAAVPIAKAMELIGARGQSAFSSLPQEKPAPTVAAKETQSAAAPPRRPTAGGQKRHRTKSRAPR